MTSEERIAIVEEITRLADDPDADPSHLEQLRNRLLDSPRKKKRLRNLLDKGECMKREDVFEAYQLGAKMSEIASAVKMSVKEVTEFLEENGVYVSAEEVKKAQSSLREINQSFTDAEVKQEKAGRKFSESWSISVKDRDKVMNYELPEVPRFQIKQGGQDVATALQRARKMLETDAEISIDEVVEKTGANKNTLTTYVNTGKIVRPETNRDNVPINGDSSKDKAEVLKLRKEIDQLKKSHKITENLLEEAKLQIGELDSEKAELERKNKKLLADIEQYKALESLAVKSANGETARIMAIQEENERLQQEIEEYKVLEQKALEELENLRKQLSQATEHLPTHRAGQVSTEANEAYEHGYDLGYKQAISEHDALLNYVFARGRLKV